MDIRKPQVLRKGNGSSSSTSDPRRVTRGTIPGINMN